VQLQSLTTYICCTHLNEDRLINAYYSAKDFSGMQAQSLHCTKWEASNTQAGGFLKCSMIMVRNLIPEL